MRSKILSGLQRAEGSWLQAAKSALSHPRKAWDFWRRTGSDAWINALFQDRIAYANFVAELKESELLDRLGDQLQSRFLHVDGVTARGNRYTPGAMLSLHAMHLYAIVREIKPEVVVETGVCNGLSSAMTLAALVRNNRGRLYSIDLPEFTGVSEGAEQFWIHKGGAVVPQGNLSGWLVPAELRGRWTLKIGKTSTILPALLPELGTIDLFIHDSEHSFENQLFEFRAAFERLRPGGILFASDINSSRAFDIFTKEISSQSTPFFVDYSLGLVVRN